MGVRRGFLRRPRQGKDMAGSEDEEGKGQEVKDEAGDPTSFSASRGRPGNGAPGTGLLQPRLALPGCVQVVWLRTQL